MEQRAQDGADRRPEDPELRAQHERTEGEPGVVQNRGQAVEQEPAAGDEHLAEDHRRGKDDRRQGHDPEQVNIELLLFGPEAAGNDWNRQRREHEQQRGDHAHREDRQGQDRLTEGLCFGLVFAAKPREDRHERCRDAAGDDDAERQLGDDERGVERVELLPGAKGARQDPVADQAHEVRAEGQDRQEDGATRHETVEQVSWVHVAMMTTDEGAPCRQRVGRSKALRSASTTGRTKQPSRWSLTMPIACIAA